MKKKKLCNPVCDDLQWKKDRNKCVTRAVWRATDNYLKSVYLFYRFGSIFFDPAIFK